MKLCVRLPRLPLNLWNENTLTKLLRPLGMVIKVDNTSNEGSTGLFTRVCMDIYISKPLKMELQYARNNVLSSCLIDYENIANTWYGSGSKEHKFDSCKLNSISLSFRVEKLQGGPMDPSSSSMNHIERTLTQEAEWIKVQPQHKRTTLK